MTAKGTKREDFAFNQEVADEFCLRMALGETVSNIHRDENMPSPKVLFKWRHLHPDFEIQYTRAREDQMHTWSDQIVTLIDDAEPANKITVKLDSADLKRIEADGYVTFEYKWTFLKHAIAKVDVRKWLMSKVLPKVFGDRLQVDATHTVENKDDAEMMHALREAMGKANMDLGDLATLLEANQENAPLH